MILQKVRNMSKFLDIYNKKCYLLLLLLNIEKVQLDLSSNYFTTTPLIFGVTYNILEKLVATFSRSI